MAKIWEKTVVTINGKDYGVGDIVFMELTSRVVLIGRIESFCISSGERSYIKLLTDKGDVEVPLRLIKD